MPFRLKLGLEKRLVLPKVIDKGQFGLQVQVETTTGRLHNGFGHIYDVDLSAEF